MPAKIATKRLEGSRVTLDDLDYLIEVDSDMRVQHWLFGQVQTPEQSRARLERWARMWDQDGLGFWIFRDADRVAVGHGGLFKSPREDAEIEVGYVIKPAYWGRGFASEITTASLKAGFELLDLTRIIGIAQARNAASRRVMEKCGMLFETELPSPDGVSGVRYAISKAAWFAQHSGRAR